MTTASTKDPAATAHRPPNKQPPPADTADRSMTDNAASSPAAQQLPPLPEGHARVFVGNLSYATTQDTVKKAFASAAGVTNVVLVTRTTRRSPDLPQSSGHAFVDFSDMQAALKAIGQFNQSEIDGRSVKVELTKTEEELKANRRPRPPRQPRRNNSNGNANQEKTEKSDENKEAEKKKRRPKKPVGKKTDDAEAPAEKPAAEPKKQPSPKKEASPAKPAQQPAPASGEEEDKKGRPARRVFHENAVFVGNLPFSMRPDGLSKLFTDAGLTVTGSFVATRRQPSRSGGRSFVQSKGFGFVEFASAKDQEKAIQMDGKEIDTRAIVVKKAEQQQQQE